MSLLLALHLMANLVWVGSIAAVGLLVGAAPALAGTPQKTVGLVARTLFLRLAQPAFGASFLMGVALIARDPSAYMHLHWFHAKATLLIAIIALHHILGAKARRMAEDDENMQKGRNGAILTGALLACAFLVVVLVVFRQSLVP